MNKTANVDQPISSKGEDTWPSKRKRLRVRDLAKGERLPAGKSNFPRLLFPRNTTVDPHIPQFVRAKC